MRTKERRFYIIGMAGKPWAYCLEANNADDAIVIGKKMGIKCNCANEIDINKHTDNGRILV